MQFKVLEKLKWKIRVSEAVSWLARLMYCFARLPLPEALRWWRREFLRDPNVREAGLLPLAALPCALLYVVLCDALYGGRVREKERCTVESR